MAPPVLELSGIRIQRGAFSLQIRDLRLEPSEFLVVVGPSGSGKSTLLYAISGRVMLGQGEVRVQSRPIHGLPPHQRPVHTCWQNGGESLFPHLNVGENVEFGLRVRGVGKVERRARAEGLLEALGLQGYARRSITSLSGGERQRVAIARTLAIYAPLVLFDEVTTGLDPELRKDLRQRLVALREENDVAMLYVTHDLSEAEELSRLTGGRVLILRDGEIQQAARWSEVYQHPANVFTARYTGLVNLFPGQIVQAAAGDEEWAFESPELGKLPLPGGSPPEEQGQGFLYGFRPESAELVAADADDAILAATVESITPDRGAADLRLRRGAQTIDVRAWSDRDCPALGQSVGLRWSPRRSFLVPKP